MCQPLYDFLNKPQTVEVDLARMTRNTWKAGSETESKIPKHHKASSFKIAINERLWSIGSTIKQPDLKSQTVRKTSFWEEKKISSY